MFTSYQKDDYAAIARRVARAKEVTSIVRLVPKVIAILLTVAFVFLFIFVLRTTWLHDYYSRFKLSKPVAPT